MSWNPWKLTAIGMALVVVTAVITGLVVANWAGKDAERTAAELKTSQPPVGTSKATATVHPAPATPATSAVPTQATIAACNETATQATQRDKTLEVVKDVAVGAAAGAAVGAAGGAIAGGGKGAGKGAAIGGLVGAGGGTLYGLNENRKNDERYREAYAGCMKSHGYAG